MRALYSNASMHTPVAPRYAQASVGVIVVNWNTGEVLKRCLECLAEQDIPITRTIVIDNASSDEHLTLPSRKPAGTRLIRLPRNVGFARANNLAVAELQDCEWIALVNPDAFLASDCLARLLEGASRHPNGACFGAVTTMAGDTDRLDGAGDIFHISGLPWRSGHGSNVNDVRLTERQIFSPCAAAALYKRQAYEMVGGFDGDFFCYCEDVDLGFRLRLAGYECWLVPDARALHIGSVSTGNQRSDFAIYHGHRNMVWVFMKDMPGLLFVMLFPLHLAMNLAAIAWFIVSGRGRVIIRAKLDALEGIPTMWRKRREIQTTRVATLMDIWRMLDKRLILLRRKPI